MKISTAATEFDSKNHRDTFTRTSRRDLKETGYDQPIYSYTAVGMV